MGSTLDASHVADPGGDLMGRWAGRFIEVEDAEFEEGVNGTVVRRAAKCHQKS
jgi:hypothetical protein